MIAENERILAIAESVRKRFEKNPTDTLKCMCAIVSAELSEEMLKNGIDHMIRYAAGCHVFITIGRNILDLTASQFGEDRIVYRPYYGKLEKEWYWRGVRCFSDSMQLIQYQHTTGWPLSQIHPTLNNQWRKRVG